VCLRNDRRVGVVNGTRATITLIDPATRTVEAVDVFHGAQLTIPAGYLDAGHVTHGYAITGHKAQGLTCEHTYTLGTETLYREWATSRCPADGSPTSSTTDQPATTTRRCTTTSTTTTHRT
jgi:ATP-dependent exoDNAse (exonuclease V) alpha subunit